MRVLLLGAPGSGKGTQAERLAVHFGVEHLSTGELLRAEIASGSALGREAAAYVERGDLVPDSVVEPLITDKVLAASRAGGYVLDGFPRNLHQARLAYDIAVTEGATLQAVVHLEVPEPELLRRLVSRGQGRSDDEEATIRHRLNVYRELTTPLLDYYAGRGLLHTVQADVAPDEVFADILRRLPQRRTASG